jgi:hypothetical protein
MWSLRCLIGICVWLGVQNLGIAWTTLDELAQYRALDAAGPAELRIGINGVVGIILLGMAASLGNRRLWAYRLALPMLASTLMFNWAWLVIYAQADFDRGRIVFVAVTSSLFMGFIGWLHWRVQKIFGERYDRKSGKKRN